MAGCQPAGAPSTQPSGGTSASDAALAATPQGTAPPAPSGSPSRETPATDTATADPEIPPSPTPITMTAAHGCRTPGQSQTVTVTATPGHQVTVNPRYADGQMGNIHGGLALAQTIDQDGTFTHTWTISPNAPTGPVEVLAGTQPTDRPAEPDTTSVIFELSDHCT